MFDLVKRGFNFLDAVGIGSAWLNAGIRKPVHPAPRRAHQRRQQSIVREIGRENQRGGEEAAK